MKKESFILSLVFFYILLSFASVSAQGTDSENSVNITINGCEIDGNGFLISTCYENSYYCASHNNPLDVFTEPRACAKNKANPVPGDICCPGASHSCRMATANDIGYDVGEYYCLPETTDCIDYGSPNECESSNNIGQCYWSGSDSGGSCVPRIDRCYDYKTETNCNQDKQNVAANDVNCKHGEYEINGVKYVISEDDCKCWWNDDIGSSGACTLNASASRTYGDGTDVTTCNYALDESDKCVEGVYSYVYYSKFFPDSSHTADGLLAGDLFCQNQTGSRACGEPVIKVPFFNYVNVIIVVLIIFAFYAYQTKFSKKDNKKK